MYCHVVLCFMLVINNVNSRSFTVVLDTTMSMKEELSTIKRNMVAVFNHVDNWSDIENYILVPFRDPDVGSPTITSSSREFLEALSAVRAEGGHSCPENSMAGIEQALQISKAESFIFVFTDAYEKDNSKLNSISKLCKTKQSQVVIFLSGNCVHEGVIDVYYDIARECFGNVFRFDSSDFRQAFAYVTDMADSNWNYHGAQETFSAKKELNITIDSFTKAISITVIGDNLAVEVLDKEGHAVPMEKIVNINHITVIRLRPSKTLYKINISCRGTGYVKYSLSKDFKFEYGFSPKLSSNLVETSRQPLPGQLSYILLKTPDTLENLEINTVELVVYDENSKQTLETYKIDEESSYYTKAYFEPRKPFKLVISGHQGTDYENYSVSSKKMTPQDVVRDPPRSKPELEIITPKPSVFEFGTNASLSCKVFGYPKPNVWWEAGDIGHSFLSEDVLIEMPNKYISYVYLQNITTNGTIFCKSNNSEGEISDSIEIYVERTFIFDILQEPEDEIITYGTDGKIYCEVNAYPEAKIKWYYNNTNLDNTEDFEIQNDGLVIKNVTLDKLGSYMCNVENEYNKKSFLATISIGGLEAPKISVEKTEVIARVNDSVKVQCRIISGLPEPTVYWTYKSNTRTEFTNLPNGATINDTNLIISHTSSAHVGLYKCEAINIVGNDSKEISIKIYQPPIIKNKVIGNLTVKEGELVELPCEVEADPKAQVRWEMCQDDVIVPFDENHSTDEQYTHRFIAVWRDSGNYHCIADNGIGKTEITVTLNVLVPPYIQTPTQKSLAVRAGDNVDLPCNVLYGNPVPTINWKFVADSVTKTIPRKQHSLSKLELKNVTSASEGLYLCIADNSIGSDTIKINLSVN